MTSVTICAVVTGEGEVEAVPILVRRIAGEVAPGLLVHLPRPLRVPESRLVKAGELENRVQFAARRAQGGGVLVVLDCDDGCPATEGPALTRRASAASLGAPVEVVLAKREFETWFVAAAVSLRGVRGLDVALEAPPDAEAIRGAKEWLKRHRMDGRGYQEVLDQPKLTARFDLSSARRGSDSFDACYRRVERLLAATRPPPA